jgi:WD40 repeat protein
MRVEKLAHIGPFNAHLRSLAMHPNGSTVAGGFDDGMIYLWASDTQRLAGTMQHVAEFAHIYGLTFSPDGKTLASASDDASLRLWDVSSCREIARLAQQRPDDDDPHWEWEQWDGFTPHTPAFSPDGKLLACGQIGGGIIKLWDVLSMKERAPLAGHPRHIVTLAFSPDGTLLLSGSHDNTVGVWDIATGQGRLLPSPNTHLVDAVAFHPSRLYFVSGGSALVPFGQPVQPTGVIHIWALPQALVQTSLILDLPFAESLMFNSAGTVLAAGDVQGQILFWDTTTWTKIGSVIGTANIVSHLLFSPDDQRIWSGAWWGDRHQSIVEVWQLTET